MFVKISISALIAALPLSSLNAAAGVPTVVISEVQTASTESASQEFVELYNPTGADISVSGWTIEYKSATGSQTAWSKRTVLEGSIKARGFYLAAPKTFIATADADWSATLASAGGNVRVKDSTGSVQDQLGYGASANAAEGAPANAPAAGHSLERLPGRLLENEGNSIDTDINASDFIDRPAPQPQNASSEVEVPLAVPDEAEPPAPLVSQPSERSYLPVEISELFIDPAAPLTDAADEYIELHNPNAKPVDLTGYVLKAGSGFRDFYTIPDIILAPDAYIALYSDQTKISLTNSGGAAQLLDPLGTIVSQSEAYASAPTGQTWAKFGGGWQWTLRTTPAAANILLAPVVVQPKPATAKALSRKPAAKATKAAKPKAPKATLAKHKATQAKNGSLTAPKVAAATIHVSAWLITVLAVLTIGYAGYEFRHDIRNFYHRARGNKAPGGTAGKIS